MSEVKKEKSSKTKTKKETKTKTAKKKETVVKVEKTKKESGVLTKKDQKRYTVLSKIIRIFAKIGKICLMIFVPFVALAMILIPIVFNKFEISANVIKFGDASVIVRDTGLSFKIGDKIHVLDCNTSDVDRIMTFLSNHSKNVIILSLELSLLILGVVTVFEIYLLGNIEKLFGNFEKGTLFTKENTDSILMIAKYLVAIKICSICIAIVGLFGDGIGTFGIFEILITFVAYYIFKYATAMQKKSDLKICD
jgi:hypothetical protein